MGAYDLVAADIDGTLLAPDGRLSERTRAVVSRLRDVDVTFVLATSRRYTGAAPVAAALAHVGPLILYDGAQIRGYPGGAIEATDALCAGVARQAAEMMHADGLRVIAQFADEMGERMRVGPPAELVAHDEAYLAKFRSQVTVVPASELIPDDEATLRLLTFGPYDTLERAAERRSAVPCGFQLLPVGNYEAAELTVFSPSASRGSALLGLGERLGVPRERIFAIGDGINDISMLRAAGLGVAMGNAGPDIQAVARAVAETSSEDGAALAIERYCLSQDMGNRR